MWKIHWMWIRIRDLRNCRQFELDIEGSECGGGGALSGYVTIRLSHHCNHNSIWQRLWIHKLNQFFSLKNNTWRDLIPQTKISQNFWRKNTIPCLLIFIYTPIFPLSFFSPTFVFFHVFLLFLSKLLMFSSPTILVPLGNKEADRWIVAKLCFQFLCWFFSDRTIIPGWCAGGRAQYGCTFENKRQIHLNSLSFLCFQILFSFYLMKELLKMWINTGT